MVVTSLPVAVDLILHYSRGAEVHLHPHGGEKNLGVIYRQKCVSAPHRQSKSHFKDIFGGRGIWRVGVVHVVFLATCDLRTTTINGSFSSFSLCFEGDD